MQHNKFQETKEPSFMHYFSKLKEPRRVGKGNFKYPLSDIFLLTISSMLCGANDWSAVVEFGEDQLPWLKKFGSFSNGIPSQDTLERVFSLIDPVSFNDCFSSWMEAIRERIKGEVVAIDGKALRGAKDKTSTYMPYIVSAWASENSICLGQQKVDEKSNEIKAIPDLIDSIFVAGCIVTIDAIGCQKSIAKKIIDAEADYILPAKGNQITLEQAIKDTVLLEKPATIDVVEDVNHGRVEVRTCKAYSNLSHIEKRQDWEKLCSVFVIESKVYDKSTRKETTEQRHYITSLPADAKMLNEKTRKHWSIENNLHWVLDVTFGEDGSRKRKQNQSQNFNIMLKSAMTLIKSDKTHKTSKKNKRLKAAISQKYREKLLRF